MTGIRIISGRLKGRRLETPRLSPARPSSDRLRERLFSILQSRLGAFEGLRIADIFAGTGALGIEAVSRGATLAWFVENDPAAIRQLRSNLERLELDDTCRILAADAMDLPKTDEPFDLLFLDPPYSRGLVPDALTSLENSGWCGPNSLIIVEAAARDRDDLPAEFAVIDQRQHGKSRLQLLQYSGSDS